jgi:hypothetical protein
MTIGIVDVAPFAARVVGSSNSHDNVHAVIYQFFREHRQPAPIGICVSGVDNVVPAFQITQFTKALLKGFEILGGSLRSGWRIKVEKPNPPELVLCQ